MTASLVVLLVITGLCLLVAGVATALVALEDWRWGEGYTPPRRGT